MNLGALQMGLSLNLNPFAQGLQQSASMMSQWASRIQQQSNRALSGIQSQMRNTGRGGQVMGGQLTTGFGSPMSSLGGLIGRLGGLYSAFELARRGLVIISDLNRLDRGLKAVSTSTADFERAQQFLQSTSQSLGQDYMALTKAYVGLKAAAQGTAIEGAATEKVFLSVAKASAALGLTTEQTEGSLLSIQQMMSKGTIQAEELRGQLSERLPGSFRLMAQGLGVTEAKLGKMLEQGEVLASVALPKLAAQLEKTYGASAQNGLKGMAGGFARLTAETQLFLKAFDNNVGIDNMVGDFLSGVSTMLSAISGLMRHVDTRMFMDLLAGRISVGDVIKGSAEKSREERRRTDDQNKFRLLTPEERERQIDDTYLNKQALDNKLTELSKRPELPDKEAQNARIKQERELERELAYQKKKYQDEVFANGELIQEERRNAERAKNNRIEGKKDKDKAVYQPKEGYEGLKALQSQFEEQIKSLQATLSDDPDVLAEIDKLTKGYDAITSSITDIETSWDSLADKSKRGIELDVRVRADGVVTDKVDFRGQAGGSYLKPSEVGRNILPPDNKWNGIANVANQQSASGLTRNFAPLPKTLTPDIMEGKLGEQKSNLANAHVRESMEQLAKLANAYRDIQRAFDQSAAPAAEARFDEIYQAALAGGMRIEEAFDKAYTTVVSAGQQLQSGLTNALQGAAQGAAEGFGELVGSIIAGVGSLDDLPEMLGKLFASIAKQMGKAMIAFGTAGIALKAFAANPVTAVVAGIGLVALGSAMEASMQKSMQSGTGKGLQKFAKGGVLDSPTVGLLAEYGNAAFNKEIVAPQKLLASVFKTELDRKMDTHADFTGGGGRQSVAVEVQFGPLRLGTNYLEMGVNHSVIDNDDAFGKRR